MAKRMKQVLNTLDQEIGRDFNSMVDDLNYQLKLITPVDTGRARKGWRKPRKAEIDQKSPLLDNRVEYSGVLDDGWSSQAPRGIVEPAFKRTRRLK